MCFTAITGVFAFTGAVGFILTFFGGLLCFLSALFELETLNLDNPLVKVTFLGMGFLTITVIGAIAQGIGLLPC